MIVAELREYMTVRQIAARLRCRRETVYKYIKKGYLNAERLDGKVLVPRCDVEAFVPPKPGNPAFRKN